MLFVKYSKFADTIFENVRALSRSLSRGTIVNDHNGGISQQPALCDLITLMVQVVLD